jgi:hypothetical protein
MFLNLRHFIKKQSRLLEKKRKDEVLDAYFNHEAKIANTGILKNNPEKQLSSKQEKMIDEYALDVFGSKSCSPWLKVYTTFRGEFLEGWMPANYWGRVVCPGINGLLQPIGRIKTLTKRISKIEAIPDLIYFVGGNWVLESGEPVTRDKASDFLFSRYPFVFLKKDDSYRGQGLMKLAKCDFEGLDLSQTGDFVIQAPITQHPFFESMSPGSVASLRVTTYRDHQQSAKTYQSSIRLGRAGTSFIAGDACVRIPIWEKEGRFYDYGFSGTWDLMESHPDTGVRFSGLMLPEFEQITAFCELQHDKNPHFPLIAWDVILDQSNQIQVMEWNTVIPTITRSEAATGPHFKGLGFENLWKQNDLE